MQKQEEGEATNRNPEKIFYQLLIPLDVKKFSKQIGINDLILCSYFHLIYFHINTSLNFNNIALVTF